MSRPRPSPRLPPSSPRSPENRPTLPLPVPSPIYYLVRAVYPVNSLLDSSDNPPTPKRWLETVIITCKVGERAALGITHFRTCSERQLVHLCPLVSCLASPPSPPCPSRSSFYSKENALGPRGLSADSPHPHCPAQTSPSGSHCPQNSRRSVRILESHTRFRRTIMFIGRFPHTCSVRILFPTFSLPITP